MIWSCHKKILGITPFHKHDVHEFFVCLNEHGAQDIEGRSYMFKRGRAFMLFSGCEHCLKFESNTKSEFIFVCFDKNHLAKSGYLQLQEELENRQKQGCYLSGDEPDYLEFNIKTISLLYKEISSPELLQNERINALLVLLLVEFLRSNSSGSSANLEMNKKRSKIIKLCQRAAVDSSIEMTLAQAARETGVCRTTFSLMIKEATGFSWREYILDCRLKKSIELLATTDIQVLEIAYKCNFNNIAYFHRAFLKKYGHTPQKMRNLLRQNRFPHIIKKYK